MRTNIFFGFLLFVGMIHPGFRKQDGNAKQGKLPIFVSYMNGSAPDSLQDFMKVYLQSKKIEVVKWSEVMTLYKLEIQEKMTSIVGSGTNEEFTRDKAKDFAKYLRPVCNILGMKIHKNKDSTARFFIDSIQWHLNVMPVIDSSKQKFVFLPDGPKDNLYTVLKSFLDTVLASGLLK